jgi:hypothetical protein
VAAAVAHVSAAAAVSGSMAGVDRRDDRRIDSCLNGVVDRRFDRRLNRCLAGCVDRFGDRDRSSQPASSEIPAPMAATEITMSQTPQIQKLLPNSPLATFDNPLTVCEVGDRRDDPERRPW